MKCYYNNNTLSLVLLEFGKATEIAPPDPNQTTINYKRREKEMVNNVGD